MKSCLPNCFEACCSPSLKPCFIETNKNWPKTVECSLRAGTTKARMLKLRVWYGSGSCGIVGACVSELNRGDVENEIRADL